MRTRRLRRALCIAVLVALEPLSEITASGGENAGEPTDVSSGRVHPLYRKAFRIALEDARRKLALTKCQGIFSDFLDREGTPLATDLLATGQSPLDYLQGIRFVDGRHSGVCVPRGVYAWTHPGSRVVCLCLDRFAVLALTTPSAAGNILIHEELHALGLGEDPPTSREITSRVGQRCGP